MGVRVLIFLAAIGSTGTYSSQTIAGRPLRTTMTQQAIANRSDLQKVDLWQDISVEVVFPGREGATSRLTAKEISYQPSPTHGVANDSAPVSLVLLSDPRTGTTYLTRGGQTFYVASDAELVACTLHGATVTLARSYAKKSATEGLRSTAITALLDEVDDQRLVAATTPESRVDLRQGMVPPYEFFMDVPMSMIWSTPTIVGVSSNGGQLRLDLLSANKKSKGTFWIDLRSLKLVRSAVDGRENGVSIR